MSTPDGIRLTIAFTAIGAMNAMREIMQKDPKKYDKMLYGEGQLEIVDKATSCCWLIEHIWDTKIDKASVDCVWDYDVSEAFGQLYVEALAENDELAAGLWDGSGVNDFIMGIIKQLEKDGCLKLLDGGEA